MFDERFSKFYHLMKPAIRNMKSLIIWLITAVCVGLVVGGIGTLFYHAMAWATKFRTENAWITFLLPVGGLMIVFMYQHFGGKDNTGTNLVLKAIQSGQHIPFQVAPLIFIATVITHLFGGSAGREGAALQLGGSIGEFIGRRIGFDDDDIHIMIMCGMSACFAAVFGTPMAAAVFSMEVISIGIMHYSALIPCVFAAFTANMLAMKFGAAPEHFPVIEVPELSVWSIAMIVILAIFLSIVSVLFCMCLHYTEHTYQHYFANPYIRVIVGSAIVIGLTLIVGNRDYIGAGMQMIERAFEGEVPWFAFFLKIVFTAVTLGAGFKGGEIVPSFFAGATFGCVVGPLLGLPVPLCAACGMIGVFCGATNSPLSSLLIAFELFGFEGMPYYMFTVAICYTLSGYYGLYSSQRIMYSKHKTRYINAHTK